MKIVAVICVALALCGMSVALSEIPPRARGGLAWKLHEERKQSLYRDSPSLFYTQKCDHFNPSSSCTFQQLYFQDESHMIAGPRRPESGVVRGDQCGATAFLYIGGESPLTGLPGGYVNTLAGDYGALVVALEHRFYGVSIPENGTASYFTVEQLKLLTVEQALADLASFLQFIDGHYAEKFGMRRAGQSTHLRNQMQGQSSSSGAGERTTCLKWIIVGGSYPGALSAWFRVTYPELVVASWSSSGVVNAIFNFVEFDEQIATSVGTTCADLMRQTTSEIEDQMPGVKALFGAQNVQWDADFFYMVADSNAMAVQYGHKEQLCGVLSAASAAGQSLAAAFANFTNTFWGPSFGGSCFYDSTCLKHDASMARAWHWQCCYELAYFQSAPMVGAIRSQNVTLMYSLAQCADIYDPSILPRTDYINDRFGGATPNATNIIFINASDDPWQQASVKATLSSSEPMVLINCDDCGHCIDLHAPSPSDPMPVQQARLIISTYLEHWLGEA